MTTDFASQGSLGAIWFPELAREIYQRQLTGGLRLSDGQMKKIVYFNRGEIYAAASNLAQDTVLALLERAGRLDQTQAREIAQQVKAGKSLGEALVERGTITREGLMGLRAEQVSAIVASLCEWEQGEYQFESGARVEGGPLGLATSNLILDGARRLRTARALWRAVGDEHTRIKLASGTEARFAQLKLTPQEAFLLTRLDAPIEIAQLLTISGFSEEETLRSVYALYCAGLITRTGYTAALKVAAQAALDLTATPEAAPEMDQAERQDIVRMAQLVVESNDDYEILGLTPPATPAEVKRAYHRLAKKYHPDRHQQDADAETIACLGNIFARVRQAYEKLKDRAPQPAEAPAEAVNHGEVSRSTAPASAAPPPATAPATTQAATAAAASSAPAAATGATVEAAPPEPEQDKARLAEINYQEGLARYQSGDIVSATELLSEAVRLNPDHAAYQVQLGLLLALNPRRRKQAEAHLLRAIELDPQNPAQYIRLGLLYKSLGFMARAEKQFGLALNLDPLNKAAMKELRVVRAQKQGKESEGQGGGAAKTKESSAGSLLSKLFKRK
jgi:tetratricopeptide (TPR) repeat protein